MKIFLIFFLFLSPFFAKEIKKESKQKSKIEKAKEKNKTTKNQNLDNEKSSVFKKNEIQVNYLNILEIKPSLNEEKYNLNSRYNPIYKYKEKDYNYESDYKLGLNYELNKETGKLDKIRIDVETKFKGIN